MANSKKDYRMYVAIGSSTRTSVGVALSGTNQMQLDYT